jgi:chromate transporter
MKNPWLYLLIFLKASLFSSGGMGNLPSLHQDLRSLGWATEADFGQALLIGQIGPGPNGLWVVSLGYLTGGYLGALFALLAITLPCLLVLVISAIYSQLKAQQWMHHMMHVVAMAVGGLLLTVCWPLLGGTSLDGRKWLIGAMAFGLGLSGRVPLLLILLLGAGMGYLCYGFR